MDGTLNLQYIFTFSNTLRELQQNNLEPSHVLEVVVGGGLLCRLFFVAYGAFSMALHFSNVLLRFHCFIINCEQRKWIDSEEEPTESECNCGSLGNFWHCKCRRS